MLSLLLNSKQKCTPTLLRSQLSTFDDPTFSRFSQIKMNSVRTVEIICLQWQAKPSTPICIFHMGTITWLHNRHLNKLSYSYTKKSFSKTSKNHQSISLLSFFSKFFDIFCSLTPFPIAIRKTISHRNNFIRPTLPV